MSNEDAPNQAMEGYVIVALNVEVGSFDEKREVTLECVAPEGTVQVVLIETGLYQCFDENGNYLGDTYIREAGGD